MLDSQSPFNIEVARDGRRRTLALSGELDMAATPQLESALSEQCEDGAEEVVLDVSGIRFIDSTGLQALISGGGFCTEHGCRFFINPELSHAVQHVFALTGVGDHFAYKRDGADPERDGADPERDGAS